ncbi:GNAT family protein [Rurimicrobium arvi]|uniref:GNAT family N-acetyltransferase n=1 Tax=Rurimicrobium arvi TaxID=2049916 RepID=A0ABP8MTS7_9BACT
MNPDFHPLLEDEKVLLRPLTPADFDAAFSVASDPAIWEQHPHKNRWQEPVFRVFFEASLASNGAFLIIERSSGEVIGGTRFYEYDQVQSAVVVGGTYFATRCWGTGVNRRVKQLMLDYIFGYLNTVCFYIDQYNIRSRTAITRLGATFCGEKPMGEGMTDFVYRITREDWRILRTQPL